MKRIKSLTIMSLILLLHSTQSFSSSCTYALDEMTIKSAEILDLDDDNEFRIHIRGSARYTGDLFRVDVDKEDLNNYVPITGLSDLEDSKKVNLSIAEEDSLSPDEDASLSINLLKLDYTKIGEGIYKATEEMEFNLEDSTKAVFLKFSIFRECQNI